MDTNILLEKLWNNSDKDETTGCWLYNGALDRGGYGTIHYQDKQISTHRISAYLYLGFNLESEMWILHIRECPHRNCWNPDHLYVGTPRENTADMDSKGREKRGRYKTHCPKGHEYTPENTRLDKRGCQNCRECNRLRYHVNR